MVDVAEDQLDDDSASGDVLPVVVGHDGSRGADRALAEGLTLARALGAPVVVVRAWSMTTAPRPDEWELGYVPPLDVYARAVHVALLEDVRPFSAAHPDVPVTLREPHADPASSLVAASRDARLLVVGARGLNPVVGLLLGSVSEQCVRHATCGVLVTRGRVDDGAGTVAGP